MFRFEEPFFLYALVLIPIAYVIYLLANRVWLSKRRSLTSDKLFSRLAPKFSETRRHAKFGFLLLSATFLFIAWSNPQWGRKKEKAKAASSDVFIALDISQSMMANDISPNRLERAKRLAQNIVRSLKGNRIGLIYFAGNAYLQMPLSHDFSAAEVFLQSANVNLAGTQGTAIADAIDLASRAFEEDEKYQRALVIITDGENHDEEALQKAEAARENGLVVFTVGVGTEEGGFIPFIDRGREQYKRDQSGNPIKSKLSVSLIKDLAAAGNGSYHLIQEGNSIINDLKKQIDKIEKQEVERKSFSEYASYYQYFLAFGLLFLILEYWWPAAASNKNRKSIFEI